MEKVDIKSILGVSSSEELEDKFVEGTDAVESAINDYVSKLVAESSKVSEKVEAEIVKPEVEDNMAVELAKVREELSSKYEAELGAMKSEMQVIKDLLSAKGVNHTKKVQDTEMVGGVENGEGVKVDWFESLMKGSERKVVWSPPKE